MLEKLAVLLRRRAPGAAGSAPQHPSRHPHTCMDMGNTPRRLPEHSLGSPGTQGPLAECRPPHPGPGADHRTLPYPGGPAYRAALPSPQPLGPRASRQSQEAGQSPGQAQHPLRQAPGSRPQLLEEGRQSLGDLGAGGAGGGGVRLRLRPWGPRPAGRKLEGLRGQRLGGVALTQALWSSLTSLFFLVMVLRKRSFWRAQQPRDQLREQDRVQGTAPRGALPGAGRRSGQALLPHLRRRGPLTPGPALWPRRELKSKGRGRSRTAWGPPSLQTWRGTLPRLCPSLQHCFPPSLSNESLQAWPDGNRASLTEFSRCPAEVGCPGPPAPAGGQHSSAPQATLPPSCVLSEAPRPSTSTPPETPAVASATRPPNEGEGS